MNIHKFDTVEKIAVCGDWHGHRNFSRQMVREAADHDVHLLVHVGDLGLNLGIDQISPETFQKPLDDVLETCDSELIWIDGNHDNHGWLKDLSIRETGFIQTGIHTFHAPRGLRWTMFGASFGALGGAFSINFADLTENVTYFKNLENIQHDDLVRLGDEKLDVLFTHEVADGIPVRKMFDLPEFHELASDRNRCLVREAVNNTRPGDVFSGHWHQRIDFSLTLDKNFTTSYHVLDKEYSTGNMVIFDNVLREVSRM